METSKPSVVETNVSQSAGSKASLAVVGLMFWRQLALSVTTSHGPGSAKFKKVHKSSTSSTSRLHDTKKPSEPERAAHRADFLSIRPPRGCEALPSTGILVK